MNSERKHDLEVAQPINLDSDEHPNGFICPITTQIMTDPVTTMGGQSYERVAIEAWFQNHDTDPMTGAALADKRLIPNVSLRKAIQEYCEKRPRLERYVHDQEKLVARLMEIQRTT